MRPTFMRHPFMRHPFKRHPFAIALVAAAIALPAAAQAPVARSGNVVGTGQSLPTSNGASNITARDTRSTIAPRLPSPDLGENAPPRAFLEAARRALAAGRTGEAQESLERAESRALDRSVSPSQVGAPSGQALVRQIAQARRTLATGDRAAALRMIGIALNTVR